MDIGPGELLVVLAIMLVLLGPTKLPKLARSLGEAIHELRSAAHHAAHDGGAEDGDPDAGVDGAPVRPDQPAPTDGPVAGDEGTPDRPDQRVQDDAAQASADGVTADSSPVRASDG